ncbi:MAG: hypothetical protein ACI8W7_004957 [Gammaproteobacteria bacterium]|jgi:hypothetical protein
MIDGAICPAVDRDPQRVSSAWVFSGTRVSRYALFDNLEQGADIGHRQKPHVDLVCA